MTREEFISLSKEVTAFINLDTLKQRPAQYMAYRRQLCALKSDTNVDDKIRLDACILDDGLKGMFNGMSHRESLERHAKTYPESSLYSSHETMTSQCRRNVIKLAEKFAFKPSPLVLGIKHYYTGK